MTKNIPSIDRLRALFDYDPETGVLTRMPCAQNKWMPTEIVGRNTYGYVVASVGGRVLKAHRIIWALVHGKWPQGEVDHINRVRHDNRISNLREASKRLNGENRSPGGSSLATDSPRSRPYRARIEAGGKTVHIGYFATAEEAREAYVSAKRKLHAGCTI